MSAPTLSQEDAGISRTRYGRVSKPPVRYEPVEQVEDDYGDDDYDTHESDSPDDEISDEDDDEDDEEEDADDDGNLAGFVVPDKSESDESDSDGPDEPPLPKPTAVKKRAPVRK